MLAGKRVTTGRNSVFGFKSVADNLLGNYLTPATETAL